MKLPVIAPKQKVIATVVVSSFLLLGVGFFLAKKFHVIAKAKGAVKTSKKATTSPAK